MEIRIDLEVIPPAVVLHDAEDFNTFNIVVRSVRHARVPVATLEQLAGCRADDSEWRSDLAKMLDYAGQHGFRDERGIRAHVEWSPDGRGHAEPRT